MQINPRHKGKGNKYCNGLTQHGGSSGISIKGKRRDPNYRIIPDRVWDLKNRKKRFLLLNYTGQDPCLNEIVPKRFINYTLSHKGGSVHSSLKCSKEYIKDR